MGEIVFSLVLLASFNTEHLATFNQLPDCEREASRIRPTLTNSQRSITCVPVNKISHQDMLGQMKSMSEMLKAIQKEMEKPL